MADKNRRDADDAQAFNSIDMLPGTEQQQNTIAVVGTPDALAPLFKKLTKVQKHFRRLQHSGKYDQGKTKYTYATEADVIEPISQKLAAEGIALIPSVVNMWWHDIPSQYNINRVATVHVQIMLADSETGAYIVASSFSTAANGDKATNAAFTTAVKYFMAKLAGVAFGDDADEYSADGTKAGKDTKKRPTPIGKPEKDKLTKRIQEANAGEQVKEMMKKNKITFSKLDTQQAADIGALLDKIEKGGD
jgi:hypothetical protein